MWNQDQSWIVFIFFVWIIGRRLLRRFLRSKNCQDPLIFPIFFDGAFGKCIGESNLPVLWDCSWTSGLEFHSLQGI